MAVSVESFLKILPRSMSISLNYPPYHWNELSTVILSLVDVVLMKRNCDPSTVLLSMVLGMKVGALNVILELRIDPTSTSFVWTSPLKIPASSSSSPPNFPYCPSNRNTAQTYAQAIEHLLRIWVTNHSASDTSFLLRTESTPAESTALRNGDKLLTHDACATLFFSTIHIFHTPSKESYFERQEGTRDEKLHHAHGFV